MSINVTERRIHVSIAPNPRQVRVTQVQLEQIRTGQQGLPGAPGQQGQDGQQGVAGPSGDGQYPVIPFTYGDASSIVMALTGDHDSEITKVTVEVETPFNGTAPQLSFGTPGQPALLVPPTYNDLRTAATYEVAPGVQLAAGQPLYLTIDPDGSTQGAGKIIVTASPLT